jgi:hypothetical protein
VIPSPPTRPRPRLIAPHPLSSSSLSSLAVYKSPLASKPADVSPAPWCAPQARPTIDPVSRVSCTSCSTPRTPFLARGHTLRWTFSCIRTYSLPFRMFRLSFFILDSSLLSLASLFVSFAIGLRLSPLPSTSRPLSRFNSAFIGCF